MKFSSTIPLALALAGGVAAAAAAQTSAATSGAGSLSPPQTIAPMAPAGDASAADAQAMPKRHSRASHARIGRMAQMERAPESAPAPTADQVKTAQQQLHAAGLYNGPTDGMMDPDTRAAIARFQQQNGLRRTETLDQQTLALLNSGQTASYGSSTPTITPAPTGAGDNAAASTGGGGNTAGTSPPKY